MDLEQIEERLASRWIDESGNPQLEKDGDSLILGIELLSNQRLIGDLAFFLTSTEHRCGEVGWVLNPEFGGAGYATEAASRLVQFGFVDLDLHRIVARVDAENLASARVAERLGMRSEAHLVESEWFKGRWSDELDFAILQREWRAQDRTSWPAG